MVLVHWPTPLPTLTSVAGETTTAGLSQVAVLRVVMATVEAPDSVTSVSKGKGMAKATVDVLVDDLDGSDGVETVRIGWNGDWRELDLSKKNLAALSKALDKYWNVSRPVSADGRSSRRRPSTTSRSRTAKTRRDPKRIRAWATDNGIPVPARGRIPGDVERRYNDANGRT
jgi:nucleoid-associated protein Lsr2